MGSLTSSEDKIITLDVDAYISEYVADSSRIRFAWNGQHSECFEDANQKFRRSVLARALEQPELAPYALIRDLFIAETKWADMSWFVDRRLRELASLLLARGRAAAIDDFLLGRSLSFDTFCACDSAAVDAELRRELRDAIAQRLMDETDAPTRSLLEEGLRFFERAIKP